MTSTLATQTAVAAKGTAFAGMLVDNGERDTPSYVSESSSEIAFGLAVIQGTADRGATLPAAQSPAFLGVVLHTNALAKDNELGDTGIKQYVAMNVMRQGRVYVYSSEAVTPAAAVRIRCDTNAGTGALLGPGTFCKSASAGHTTLITKGAKWLESAGPGIVALQLDFGALAMTSD